MVYIEKLLFIYGLYWLYMFILLISFILFMEYVGMLWNMLEYCGIFWNIVEYYGNEWFSWNMTMIYGHHIEYKSIIIVGELNRKIRWFLMEYSHGYRM